MEQRKPASEGESSRSWKKHCVISSGYSDDPVVAGYADYGFADVLAKPYQAGEVSEVLGKVIGAHA